MKNGKTQEQIHVESMFQNSVRSPALMRWRSKTESKTKTKNQSLSIFQNSLKAGVMTGARSSLCLLTPANFAFLCVILHVKT